jgi:hypothetical protein
MFNFTITIRLIFIVLTLNVCLPGLAQQTNSVPFADQRAGAAGQFGRRIGG